MESTTGFDFVQVRNFLRHLNETSYGLVPSAVQRVPEAYSSWVKWPKPESDRSYLGSAEVRNMLNI